MSIRAGEQMPSGTFGIMTADGPAAISADELFAGKKVVLVSVPGAFTPTCSNAHLPGFVARAREIADKGVDAIAFMAVNDVHVMHAWGIDQDVGDSVTMLADGNGDYARLLGLDVDLSQAGMGMRGKRFAIVVDDGVASHVGVEAPGQFEVSSAEAILSAL